MLAKTAMQTYSGKAFDLANPTSEMITIEDIAHHLSLINRFTGATTVPYNVADHSLRVMELVESIDPQHALAALLHDSQEAYLGDVSSPLKRIPEMAGYKAREKALQRLIFAKYGISPHIPEVVKAADLVMLNNEAHGLCEPLNPEVWNRWNLPAPLTEFAPPLPSELAERLFLENFVRLDSKRHGPAKDGFSM